MAEALIRVRDVKGGIDVEVKYSPQPSSDSAAHQLIAKFIEIAGLELVEVDDKPANKQ